MPWGSTPCVWRPTWCLLLRSINGSSGTQDRRAEVISGFRMDVVSQWGGGVRCASHPLLRDQ